ncbi:MAG: anhydro-N-acetylmuramic acid kinase [Micavibrio sp.]|nr:MAG: anhydro-N-acetylmuramic acid kinase [Micavibrio sp.]
MMSEGRIYTAIGMMSGTSMDGLDVALIRTDGRQLVKALGHTIVPYEDDFRKLMRSVLKERDPERIAAVEQAFTQMHALAVETLLLKTGMEMSDIHVIGMHGQTVVHEPEKGKTWQIGDGAVLAEMTGVPVVYDFRSTDMAAGGQGAPLVPVYHEALAAKLEKPVVFLNIGGVANITWIDGRGSLLSCDTGPGNAMIDDWLLEKTGRAYDKDGSAAAAGKTDQKALETLMAHPFFTMPPPKSLDRDAFDPAPVSGLSIEDGAATLAAFTVESIAKIGTLLPEKPKQFLVCGGGRHNTHLMQQLSERLGISVRPVEDIGVNGDILEAEAFAYMAVRRMCDLPISFPGTTGVPQPLTGGVLSLPKDGESATI